MFIGFFIIVMLFIVLGICALVGLGFLLGGDRGKSSGILSMIAGGFALLVFFFVISMFFVSEQSSREVRHREVQIAVGSTDEDSQRRDAPDLQIRYASTDGKTGATEIITESADDQLEEEPVAVSREAATGQPDWVGQPPQRVGQIYRTTVVSDPKLTEKEADQSLTAPIMEVARDYVDQLLGSGASETIGLDPEQIRNDVCKAEYSQPHDSPTVGPMVRMHVLMEFDESFRNSVRQRYREAVVQQRMILAGGGAFSLLIILGSIFGYLQIDTATKGFYSGRLKLVTAAVILTVLLLGMLLVRV